jgi:hypothetical protein
MQAHLTHTTTTQALESRSGHLVAWRNAAPTRRYGSALRRALIQATRVATIWGKACEQGPARGQVFVMPSVSPCVS